MNIGYIFNLILYQPLFNILIVIYQYIPGHDFGVAVIVLTFLIRLVFYPLSLKAIKTQAGINKIQPMIKELQEKYKTDKEKQAKEMLELYKREKINPFSGFLFLLIQLPVLIALYQLFWQGLKPEQMSLLYSFIQSPGTINPSFLGIMNLSNPNVILALLSAVAQYWQVKMTTVKSKSKKSGDFAAIMQNQMLYFFPVFTFFILFRLPAALGLYWLSTSAFTIIQQYIFLKSKKDNGLLQPEKN